MIAIKTVSAPVLAVGAIDVQFGQYDKVLKAVIAFDDPFDADTIYGHERSISGNTVTVTIKKTVNVLGAFEPWELAGDSDIAGGTLTIVAEGI